MARGWESKAVEEQIDSAEGERAQRTATRATPEQIARERELDSVRLSRTRVLHDLDMATHPRHRESLEAALRFLEDKIGKLQNG